MSSVFSLFYYIDVKTEQLCAGLLLRVWQRQGSPGRGEERHGGAGQDPEDRGADGRHQTLLLLPAHRV